MLYVKENTETIPVTDKCEIHHMYQGDKIAGIIEVYNNGVFKSYCSRYINHFEVEYKPIEKSGLWYGQFSNFLILISGLYASKIYSCQFTIQNSGIIWATCPTLHSSKQSVNGCIIQYGNNTDRTTHLNASVVGQLV